MNFSFLADIRCSKTTDSNARSLTTSSSYSSYISGKRGKRQRTTHSVLGTGEGKYYCTCCWKNFTSASVWKRHEKTIHNPEATYECRMADMIGSLENTCGACLISADNPSEVICLKSGQHHYDRCANWSKEARTFTRIDNFRAHLRAIHNADITPAMNSWIHFSYRKTLSECGYCGWWFPSWSERLVHIDKHYREEDGLDRSKWRFAMDKTSTSTDSVAQPRHGHLEDHDSSALPHYNHLILDINRSVLDQFKVRDPRLGLGNDWSLEDWQAEGLAAGGKEKWKSTSAMKTVYKGLSVSKQSNSRTSHANDCCAGIHGGECKFDMLRYMQAT